MNCIKCGKNIPDEKICCDDCLSTETTYDADLIQDEIDFAREESMEDLKLEDTKELVDLETLNSDINDNDLEDDLNTREGRNNRKRKMNKIIIVLCILFGLLLILLLFLIFRKETPKEETYEIDYEKVLNMYGKKLEKKVKSDTDIEELDDVEIEFDYDISCLKKEINDDRTIYLDECTINDKKVSFSYGEKKTEKSLKIEIYKNDGEYNNTEGTLISEIECDSNSCEYIKAFDNYVIIKEEDDYYLYNYTNSKKVSDSFSDYVILNIGNKLYGIYYTKNGYNYLYSTEKDKEFSDIQGRLLTEDDRFNPESFYKYGYAVFDNDGYDFINFKTGKVSYSIKDNILKVDEDLSNNVAYILTYTLNPNSFKIINTHGKELFNGASFNYFKLDSNQIIVADSKEFKTYDLKLNLNSSSKTYDYILTVQDDYVIALDKSKIKLVDLYDNLLSSFDLSSMDYEVDTSNTGWGEINGKKYMIIHFKGTKTVVYYDEAKGELVKKGEE